MYGWGQNEDAARARAQGPARPGRAHHQVRPGPEPGRQGQPRGRQARLRGAGVRREPQAARRRRHRSLLPAPRRPQGADRGHGGRDGAAGRAGQGALPSACRRPRPTTIRRAHAVHPISAVQSEYSLLYREPGRGDDATCRALGISYVAYSPLGRGLPTATITSSTTFPRTTGGASTRASRTQNFDHNMEAGRARSRRWREEKGVHAVAARRSPGCSRRARTSCPSPAPSASRAWRRTWAPLAVTLDADDLARIDEAMPPGAAAGSRYPEPQMKAVHI